MIERALQDFVDLSTAHKILVNQLVHKLLECQGTQAQTTRQVDCLLRTVFSKHQDVQQMGVSPSQPTHQVPRDL